MVRVRGRSVQGFGQSRPLLPAAAPPLRPRRARSAWAPRGAGQRAPFGRPGGLAGAPELLLRAGASPWPRFAPRSALCFPRESRARAERSAAAERASAGARRRPAVPPGSESAPPGVGARARGDAPGRTARCAGGERGSVASGARAERGPGRSWGEGPALRRPGLWRQAAAPAFRAPGGGSRQTVSRDGGRGGWGVVGATRGLSVGEGERTGPGAGDGRRSSGELCWPPGCWGPPGGGKGIKYPEKRQVRLLEMTLLLY